MFTWMIGFIFCVYRFYFFDSTGLLSYRLNRIYFVNQVYQVLVCTLTGLTGFILYFNRYYRGWGHSR